MEIINTKIKLENFKLESLKVEGSNVTDPTDIKEAIKSYYENLYKETEVWRPELQLQGITCINEDEKEELQKQIEEEEILECIKLCAMEKAPGPDGFPMSFYLIFWEVMKEDIKGMIHEFYNNQRTERSFNATFVALIPKKDVIRSKYGEYNPWCSNVNVDAYGVGVWRTIRNLWQKLEANTYIEVGNGRSTKFWTDAWNKQIPLKESFPDLFLPCSNPDANINECWTAQGWDLIFRRFLNDWEVERVAKLLELLEKFPGIINAPDSLRWKHSKDGAFTVSRAYKMESPQQRNSKQSLWRKSHKNKLDHARAYCRFVELLDKKRREQESKGMAEDNSTLHLVDTPSWVSIAHPFQPVFGHEFSPYSQPTLAEILTLFLGPMWAPSLGFHVGPIFLPLDLNHEICVALTPFFTIIVGLIFELFFPNKHLNDFSLKPVNLNASRPASMLSIMVLWNPFEDIVPRAKPAEALPSGVATEKKDAKQKATKKLNLLSFGEEAEEEEKELVAVSSRIRSSHDVLDDPRLLKEGKHDQALDSSEGKSTRDVQLTIREALGSKKEASRKESEAGFQESLDNSDEDEAGFDSRMRQQILKRRKELGDPPPKQKLLSGPWVVGGDFNTVRFPSEKRNCTRFNKAMTDFTDFIEDAELLDIQLAGDVFTWKNGEGHDPAARLDRFLISEEWENTFKNIKQSTLQRVISDHCPLILECGNWERPNSYFKFENWWLQTENFKEMVKTWWDSSNFRGKLDFILASKLKYLKDKLKEWSRTRQGNLGLQKQSILNQLADLERIQDQRQLTDDESYLRAVLTVEFEDNAKREEVAWRQRSRALWLKEGDRNTKFFHRTANSHRRYNKIDKISVNGVCTQEPAIIKEEILNFYQNIYTETERWRPQFIARNDKMISEGDNIMLQSQFTEDEIKDCVMACAGDKAPGPDGYTMAFFITCWEVVKKEVVAAVQNFHDHGIFERSFNATFIALIPKKIGAKELTDFRPISLIGSIYKIISKVLTERLKKVVYNLVDVQQMAFIKGRQIMDAILIANECVEERKNSKVPGILCKLDIEKAYDHLHWGFLWKSLENMGFGGKWLKWIEFCTTTVKFSILINGAPSGFFSSERGLRQGDPFTFPLYPGDGGPK
ncbi:hypothetical protein MTR67_035670 [Solanum verrucosum]|uniref:Reverse transcriptase domain-containing protein n=1 Tax=Solanum verrucosum TaxID=315347 RepID=A0AAF0UAM7_SOLVR|nr:hypothetical protein MTR67_035670 [Solanum verrucosum]